MNSLWINSLEGNNVTPALRSSMFIKSSFGPVFWETEVWYCYSSVLVGRNEFFGGYYLWGRDNRIRSRKLVQCGGT